MSYDISWRELAQVIRQNGMPATMTDVNNRPLTTAEFVATTIESILDEKSQRTTNLEYSVVQLLSIIHKMTDKGPGVYESEFQEAISKARSLIE